MSYTVPSTSKPAGAGGGEPINVTVVLPPIVTCEKLTVTDGTGPGGVTVTFAPVGVFPGFTVIELVSALSNNCGSASLPVTLAVSVMVPAAVALTTIVKVAVAPLARLPIMQVSTLPDGAQLPCVIESETGEKLPVSVFVATTPVAGLGPKLNTLTVQVTSSPTKTGFVGNELPIARSVFGFTVVFCIALLL